jgi:tetratricopeptide (TPR) repeat protein
VTPFRFPDAWTLALSGCLLLLQGGAPPVPAPAPAQDAAGKPKAPPLTVEALDIHLLRAQRNLILNGLSLDSGYLRRAAKDYRSAVDGLPEAVDPERRFTALMGLAFCLARMEPPADAAGKAARARETFDLLGRAANLETVPPGFYANHPGLWIVDGLMQEQVGEFKAAEAQITRGLAELDGAPGIPPWLDYQFRLFGLLARGRAFLKGSEHLARSDFKEALALAEKALMDPLAPRENALRSVVLTHLAAAHQALESFEDAERVLAELVRRDPANPAHPYNMALVKAIQQKYVESLAWYRRAADLDRSDPRPHLKIAFILLRYIEPIDTAEAVREGEIHLRLVGGKPDAEYCALRGEAAFLGKDMKEAEAWFRKALALDGACRTALQRLMNILGQKDDPTGAIQKEIDDLRRKLEDSTKKKGEGGPGMETKKTDMTFC